MAIVKYGKHFDKDLSALPEDEQCLIDALLCDIEEDGELFDSLHEQYFEHNSEPLYNVKTIVNFHRHPPGKRFNLYRIRALDRTISKYRLVYGYDGREESITFFAVVEKGTENGQYNYEPDDPISKRIIDECMEYGICRY